MQLAQLFFVDTINEVCQKVQKSDLQSEVGDTGIKMSSSTQLTKNKL